MDETYKFYSGRPSNEESCLPREIEVYDFLEKHGIEFKTLKHPVAATIQECENIRKRVDAPVFKNLFLTNKQETKFYLLILPGDKVFKTKYLSAQINSARLSFAGENHMERLLGLKPGSVSPMGLINDKEFMVTLLIDDELKDSTQFACHPCINSASVILDFKDFIEKFIPATNHSPVWVTLPDGSSGSPA